MARAKRQGLLTWAKNSRQELADHDKKNVYIERLAGEKTNVSLMGANNNQDFSDKFYYYRYTLKAGETMVCRMITEDK
jgi:hypothetical protein